jgi:hypothetical protein
MKEEIRAFIGEKVKYDEFGGQYFWAIDKNGGNQMIAEIRGWGAIQNLFKNKDGSVDFEKAEEFQDKLGEWIADAINQKLNSTTETERCYSGKEVLEIALKCSEYGYNYHKETQFPQVEFSEHCKNNMLQYYQYVLSKEYGIKI